MATAPTATKWNAGDIVWVKCDESTPWWPAIVCSPSLALSELTNDRLEGDDTLVLFYGSWDFGWLRTDPGVNIASFHTDNEVNRAAASDDEELQQAIKDADNKALPPTDAYEGAYKWSEHVRETAVPKQPPKKRPKPNKPSLASSITASIPLRIREPPPPKNETRLQFRSLPSDIGINTVALHPTTATQIGLHISPLNGVGFVSIRSETRRTASRALVRDVFDPDFIYLDSHSHHNMGNLDATESLRVAPVEPHPLEWVEFSTKFPEKCENAEDIVKAWLIPLFLEAYCPVTLSDEITVTNPEDVQEEPDTTHIPIPLCFRVVNIEPYASGIVGPTTVLNLVNET